MMTIGARRVLAAAGCLAVALAGAVSAQPARSAAPPTVVSPVVIPGQRQLDEMALRLIVAPFVELHAAPSRKTGLLVRIPHAGVCPVTLGLPAAYGDFVDRRIREVAREVGAGVEPEGRCQPNVEVLFTDDPQGVVNALSKRTRGGILGVHFWHDTPQIIHVTHPVQAWWVTGVINDTFGTNTTVVGRDGVQETPHRRVVIDNAYGPGAFTGTGSHVPPRNAGQIVNALIVVDARKLAGHEIGPVADYAAALALSQAQALDRCSKLPSILDLFASDCPDDTKAQALTDSDILFLKALYASDITTTGARGRDYVERNMVKELGRSKP